MFTIVDRHFLQILVISIQPQASTYTSLVTGLASLAVLGCLVSALHTDNEAVLRPALLYIPIHTIKVDMKTSKFDYDDIYNIYDNV